MIEWLGGLPAWALFPLFAVAAIGVLLVLDALVRPRIIPEEARRGAGPTAATTLQALATIYAVLVAFVIVDEYSQFRDAQSEVSDKAAQLAVITENSRALPGPEATAIQQATIGYARYVVDVGLPRLENRTDPSPVADRVFEDLYRTVQRIEATTPSQVAAYDRITSSLADVTETRTALIDSARASIPASLFWILAVLATGILAVATAMDTRHRRSHLFILSVLALAMALSLALVVSLDYPYRGFIRVDDTPLEQFISTRSLR